MRGSIYIDKNTKGRIGIYVDVSYKEMPGLVSKLYEGNNVESAIKVLNNYRESQHKKLEAKKQNIDKNVNIAINRIKRLEEE